MRRFVPMSIVLAALALAAGCGKTGSSLQPNDPSPDRSAFLAVLRDSYLSGSVLPTTLDGDACLLATVQVDGIASGLALFYWNTSYVAAGTVSTWSNAFPGPTTGADTLTRRSALVGSTPNYVYTSVPSLPATPPILFDGVASNSFMVSGGGGPIAGFSDAIQSVAAPAVSAPAQLALLNHRAAMTVQWATAGTDTTLYVQCALRSDADTTLVALGALVRDNAGTTTIPAAAVAQLVPGTGRLSVARYRLVRHTTAGVKLNLVCEAVKRVFLTLN